MSIFSHPVQHPRVDVSNIACDMQSCIELKNKLLIPINYVRAEIEQASVMNHAGDLRESRHGFHVHMRNMLMIEDFVLVEEH